MAAVKPGAEHPSILSPMGAAARYRFDPDSLLQRRITAVVRHFDVTLPLSNPQLLESFRTRNSRWDAESLALTVAWTGEYPGKWLTHCSELWRLTQDPELRATIQLAVDELAACQAEDGYLAPWPDSRRWSTQHWDTWGHYHCMIGCLLWADASGDPTALAVAKKIGDVVSGVFTTPQKLFAQGGLEQNMAILHSVACLFTRTRDPKLLAFCNVVLAEVCFLVSCFFLHRKFKKCFVLYSSRCPPLGITSATPSPANNSTKAPKPDGKRCAA